MPPPDLIREADRLMTICNACRYCEGYCAVFPAMERRTSFEEPDLLFLSNLCFECRACYYACPYAPPHELEVNVPEILARLRLETYARFSFPRALGSLFRRNRLAVSLLTAFGLATVLLLTLAFTGPEALLTRHLGEGAFYAVIPYGAMVFPATVLLGYGVLELLAGGVRFWRRTGGAARDLVDVRALLKATRDAIGMEYAKGGGEGCNYPTGEFSHARRWYHHLVVWGFALNLASTTTAAFYHHFLELLAPYPVWSWPVMLGTVGGVAMVIGTVGLLVLKRKTDRDPEVEAVRQMDVAFLILLLMTSLSGLVLLALRSTAAMGILLAVHLGFVAGLFLSLPYGKLAHVAYRYAALVQDAVERSTERSTERA